MSKPLVLFFCPGGTISAPPLEGVGWLGGFQRGNGECDHGSPFWLAWPLLGRSRLEICSPRLSTSLPEICPARNPKRDSQGPEPEVGDVQTGNVPWQELCELLHVEDEDIVQAGKAEDERLLRLRADPSEESIKGVEGMLKENEKTIAQLAGGIDTMVLLNEKDKTISAKDKSIAKKDKTIAELEQRLKQFEQAGAPAVFIKTKAVGGGNHFIKRRTGE